MKKKTFLVKKPILKWLTIKWLTFSSKRSNLLLLRAVLLAGKIRIFSQRILRDTKEWIFSKCDATKQHSKSLQVISEFKPFLWLLEENVNLNQME